jgi:Holliday junction resolvase RusA-like endonuclease
MSLPFETTLPVPVPSKKNSRINTASGRSFPSKDYTQWQNTARLEARMKYKVEPVTCDLMVRVTAYGLGNDADNLASSVLDMLEGIVYVNDAQVKYLQVRRHPAKRVDRKCVVRVEEVQDDGA